MKRSKKEIEDQTKVVVRDLLCWGGLKNAKKVSADVKRELLGEQKRRQNLKKSR